MRQKYQIKWYGGQICGLTIVFVLYSSWSFAKQVIDTLPLCSVLWKNLYTPKYLILRTIHTHTHYSQKNSIRTWHVLAIALARCYFVGLFFVSFPLLFLHVCSFSCVFLVEWSHLILLHIELNRGAPLRKFKILFK